MVPTNIKENTNTNESGSEDLTSRVNKIMNAVKEANADNVTLTITQTITSGIIGKNQKITVITAYSTDKPEVIAAITGAMTGAGDGEGE